MIGVGMQLNAAIRPGQNVRYRIAAIRHAPFSYVELEPVLGGPRRPVPLRVAEDMQRVTDDDKPSIAELTRAELRRRSAPHADR